jgi:hypothetical protein
MKSRRSVQSEFDCKGEGEVFEEHFDAMERDVISVRTEV